MTTEELRLGGKQRTRQRERDKEFESEKKKSCEGLNK